MKDKSKKSRIESNAKNMKKNSTERKELSTEEKKNNKTENIIKKEENNKENKNKKKSKVLKIILIIILILLILGIAVFSAYLVKSKGNVAEAALDIVTDFVGEQAPIFALILGVSEDISVPLTDTIILAGYNPQTQNAFMVSIPRDTYVGTNQIWANGYDKINAQYQEGCENTVKAVEELTGVTIDYYVVIKNNALVDVVDSIGGVKFDVPIDMDYDDITQNLHIHLNSGMQTLTGAQAEGLVRFRHNNDGSTYPSSYGDNDYGRMRTQREFIKTLAKQVIQLDNVPKVKSIVTAIFDNIETDITLSKALAYIPFGLELDIENNLMMEQLPGESNLINELWFYVPNYEEIGELFDELIEKLELEDDFEKKHYKKITKSNIKIIKENKKENKTNLKEKDEIIENSGIPENTIINQQDEYRNVVDENNNLIIQETEKEDYTSQSSNTNVVNNVKNEMKNTSTNMVTNKNITTTNKITEKNTIIAENTVKNESVDTSASGKYAPTTSKSESDKTSNITNTKEENTQIDNSQ